MFNTYTLLIIAGVVKYIPFASRSSLNSMLQISNELEEAAIIQNASWVKRMVKIIIPIQKSSIISGYLLPFMTCLRELSLFLLLCTQGFILSTTLDYFDEMGLYRHALVCERHTGAGLSITDIEKQNLPLPHRDLLPLSLEEKIVCYADKFFSKSHPDDQARILSVARSKLLKFGDDTIARFDMMATLFGEP